MIQNQSMQQHSSADAKLALTPVRMYTHDFAQHVHTHFARLRSEAPVTPAKMTRRQTVYLITRYADVVAALKDERIVKNPNAVGGASQAMPWMPKSFEPLLHNMLNMDDPDHRRLRDLVHKAFTPRMIIGLTGRIEAIANELLDKALAAEKVDLIKAFAMPLPVTIIAELIGIPPEERMRFRKWTERIVVEPTPIKMIGAVPAVWQFMRYMRKLADQRRVDPRDDLITALIQAEENGDRFSEDELLGMLFLLLVAGHETTVNLIGNGVLALLNHPEQLAQWRADPNIAESAVEELLRYDSPVMTAEMAFAREELTIHGVTIPKGATVLPALISANRDETVFTNPNQLDLLRSPNRHLAFGQGIHYCLGAPLAR
ncbi:MAG: cytochrome P450, partial [Caldilineaceae bacterium]|nr:cytochrome P450 [Caldilineaceae bacterium]